MAGIELYAERKETHRRTWTWATLVLVVVFVILGQVLTVVPLAVVSPEMLQGEADGLMADWRTLAYILFAFIFSAGLLALWVWLFERRGLPALGLNTQGFSRFLRGYGIGLVFLAAVVGGIYALGGYSIEGNGVWVAPALMSIVPLLVLLAGFIVQGSTEEYLMRGWLMQIVASRHGIIWAMVANALVFSLLHGMNIRPSPELATGLLNIVLVGVFFSLYAIKERSLWGVCGWHASWNWLLGVGFGLEVSGQKVEVTPLLVDLKGLESAPWWITGGNFGPEGSVVATVVIGAGVIWLLATGALKPDPTLYSTPQTTTSEVF